MRDSSSPTLDHCANASERRAPACTASSQGPAPSDGRRPFGRAADRERCRQGCDGRDGGGSAIVSMVWHSKAARCYIPSSARSESKSEKAWPMRSRFISEMPSGCMACCSGPAPIVTSQ